MSKLLLLVSISILMATHSYAQDEGNSASSKGSFLIEVNTGFGEVSMANTSLIFRYREEGEEWAIGGEGGYFIADDLALKIGLGFSDLGNNDNIAGDLSWKLGAKYYVASKFPVQIDLNGSRRTYGDNPDFDLSTPPVETPDATPLWLGFQAGYAWFVANNVSIEPGLRYGIGLNDDADNIGSDFAFNIGFNVFFSR